MTKSKVRRDEKGRRLRDGEYKRTDGRYAYRWTDRSGKRHIVYGKTLIELRELENEIKMEQLRGVIRSDITLSNLVESYLDLKASLSASTQQNYHYYFEKDIQNDIFGGMLVRDIKKSDVLQFYSRKSKESGYKNGTIHILHKMIHPALELAVDDDIIYKNPSNGCMREYPVEEEVKYALTFEQEREFLERIRLMPRIARYYPFYGIMLYTGLRISEICGLTWADVNMKKREININHQLQYRKVGKETKFFCVDPGNGKKTMKTKSGNRIIPMTQDVYDLFVEQRKEWFRINKDPKFSVDGYSDFVFLSHMTGRCLYANNVRRQLDSIVAMNAEREVQLPGISPHILRHTACTRFAESGMDIKTVQYLMGHSDLKTTVRIYDHVDSERARRELEKYSDFQRVLANEF